MKIVAIACTHVKSKIARSFDTYIFHLSRRRLLHALQQLRLLQSLRRSHVGAAQSQSLFRNREAVGDEERSGQEKRFRRGHPHRHGDPQGLRGGTAAHNPEHHVEITGQVECSAK